ncbi:hypothetical protein OHB01_19655 [Microbispora hainanensis]|uniref:hypothetical protein n=1 Tax=Microbispora TaxID=2005 RepID=UPI00115A7E53|nr:MULTISPECIES: hypothetical protein [Microbispora]NJP24855.1 hypothetical protein [Microbispora sp. CL1-1]TQS14318.1 hypothetical protein FLW53_11680 [Microbispora sp. SCL1-1]
MGSPAPMGLEAGRTIGTMGAGAGPRGTIGTMGAGAGPRGTIGTMGLGRAARDHWNDRLVP